MFSTRDIQDEIIRLKKENDVCILAHAYQTQDILEVADFTGDSYGLSKQAMNAPQQNVLMCGVRFMAETCKLLSPQKKVILSNPTAGCPMAEQLPPEELEALKAKYPDSAVVAYINTTAELKCLCDVCVTSSSAVDIVRKMPQKDIIFIPDCNLGSWVKEHVPEKNFHFIQGGCPIHMIITVNDIENARKFHPNAVIALHPECKKEVTALADFAGSTTAIMSYVDNHDYDEYVIGTDNSIVQHLQFKYPDKKFFPLKKECICKNMKATTLIDVYNCVRGKGGEEIVMNDYVMKKARECIDAMLKY